MPRVRELAGRNYYVNVTSPDGQLTYMGRRQLYFNSDDFGFLFVKTDKPIYKPEQDGESSVEGMGTHLFIAHSLSLSLSLSLSWSLSTLPITFLLLLPYSLPFINHYSWILLGIFGQDSQTSRRPQWSKLFKCMSLSVFIRLVVLAY